MNEKSKKVLFIATVVKKHIVHFHIPYLKMFKEMGYKTVVVARNDYENPSNCQIPYCDHYIDIPFHREPINRENFQCYKILKKIIDEGDFSVIHCHTPVGGVIGRLAARKARKNGTCVMYTAHGFHFYKGAPLKNWLLFYPIEKLCSRFTDVLITINKEDYALAKKRMKAKCVEYVPGVGIDLEKFKRSSEKNAEKRRELGIPEDAILLLSVGELIPRKNHETSIRAIATMDVYYVIVGDGVMCRYLQKLIDELGVSDRVKLLGYRKDVCDLYNAADIFVFPSLQEGLPVSVMEAMACGTPCVASKIRGNVDLLENTEGEFLCTPNNIEEYSTKLQLLISNADLREKVGQNNEKAIQPFGIAEVCRKMQKIYDNTLHEKFLSCSERLHKD